MRGGNSVGEYRAVSLYGSLGFQREGSFRNALEAGIICIYTAASTRMERVKEARYESGFSYLFRLGGNCGERAVSFDKK